MLDFDVEIAEIATLCETGRVVTRSGKRVTILEVDLNESPYPVLGRINGLLGDMTWMIDGKYFQDGRESEYDLFIEELC